MVVNMVHWGPLRPFDDDGRIPWAGAVCEGIVRVWFLAVGGWGGRSSGG